MKTVKIHGIDVQVVEHMKEITEVCSNSILFKRWYNRGQMFKALLGNFIFNGEPEECEEYGEYGECLGRIVKSEADCWFIEVYKAEDIEESIFKDILEWQIDRCQSAFFIEHKDGTIYLVLTDID